MRSDERERDDLHQIDLEHREAGGAERLQRGDDVATPVEMALDGVRDADAADDQRGQPDERQILGKSLDVLRHRRRSAGAGANFPAGLGQLRLRGGGHRLHGRIGCGAVGKPQAVMPAHHAAGLDEPGGAQRCFAHEKTRPKPDPAGELVGLRRQDGAQFDRSGADRDAVSTRPFLINAYRFSQEA